MPELNCTPGQIREKAQWNRNDISYTVINFELAKEKQSKRQFAKAQGVPRTTLQHWLARKDCIDALPTLSKWSRGMITLEVAQSKKDLVLAL